LRQNWRYMLAMWLAAGGVNALLFGWVAIDTDAGDKSTLDC
jgi:hypothetical protein